MSVHEAAPFDRSTGAEVETFKDTAVEEIGGVPQSRGGWGEGDPGIATDEAPGAFERELERGGGRLDADQWLADVVSAAWRRVVTHDEDPVVGDGESQRSGLTEVPGSALHYLAREGFEALELADGPEVDGIPEKQGASEDSQGEGAEPADYSSRDVQPGENSCTPHDEGVPGDPDHLGSHDEGIVPDEKTRFLVEGENASIIPGHADDHVSADDRFCAQVFRDETGVLPAVVVNPVNAPVAHVTANDHPGIGIAVDCPAMDSDGIPVDGILRGRLLHAPGQVGGPACAGEIS